MRVRVDRHHGTLMCIVERFVDGMHLCEFVLCVFVFVTVSVCVYVCVASAPWDSDVH